MSQISFMEVLEDSVVKEQVKRATSGKDPAVTARRDQARAGGSASLSKERQETPASARALLRLLQVTGLSSPDRGWRYVVYTGLASVIYTALVAMLLLTGILQGLKALRQGKPLVYILSYTAFFGLEFGLMWLSLMICFVFSQCRYGKLLLSVGELMERNVLQGSTLSTRMLRKRFNWLLCKAII